MISAARAHLAAALAGLGIPVHAYPPGTLTAPAAVIEWGSPLVTPTTSSRDLVGLEVHISTSSAAGRSSVERIEDLVDAAVAALVTAAGIRVDPVPEPTSLDSGTHKAVIPVYVSTQRGVTP